MRVTENSNYDTVRESIRRSKERMENLQLQSSTLRKVNQPSDDPIGATKILEMRTEKTNNDQFQMNAKVAEAFLSNTELAIGELSEIVVRAKEIAIGQSSAASSNEDTRLGVAEEVTQLFKHAVSIGNRRVGDRYLFGGYKTQKPPLDAEGTYKGDHGQMMVEIASDVFLAMNIPGADVFNTHTPSVSQGSQNQKGYGENSGEQSGDPEPLENVNLFEEIQNFRIGLLTGDIDGIRNTLERFDQIQGKLVAMRARLGSRIQGLQSTAQAIERRNITNATLASSLEDADMAQVVSDLGKEETVFRSALASSKKLIQPTLLDFLK